MNTQQAVAENVRAWAGRKGHTQSAIARELRISQPAASRRWWGDDLAWSLNQIEQLANAFGIDVAELLDLSRTRRDSNPQPADPGEVPNVFRLPRREPDRLPTAA